MSAAIQGAGSKKSGPPKLRAACNQCNSAKVKCTGQRDGCDRCRTLGVDCIYVESRVGKVPGTRAKKPRQHSKALSTDGFSRSKSISPEQHTSVYSNTPPSNYYSQEEPTEWEIEQHINDELMEFGNSGSVYADQTELGNIQISASPSLDNEIRAPDMDFHGESLFSQMGCQNNHALMSLAYAPTESSFSTTSGTKNPTNKADSHCILACTQMIDRLERYIFDELTTLDLVLDIVKKYLGNLDGLISLHTTTLSFSCKALFSIIMHQIISLLEGGCRNFQKEKSSQNQLSVDPWNTGLNQPLPMFPIFGFGVFEIDADEQHLWRSQVILKELHRSLAILGKLNGLMGNDSDSSRGPQSWNAEFEERIRTLCDHLKNEKR